MASTVPLLPRPRLRGRLHAAMFPLVLLAGGVLVAAATSPRGRATCAVFALAAACLFGISALYHRGRAGPGATAVLRRLDHANIFLIIAATYTPLSVLLLPPASARNLLAGVWAGAVAGIAFRVFWLSAPRWLYTPCYILLGWSAVFFLPDFWRNGGALVTLLILAGGVLYSAGGIIYALKRPNPLPHWFGFHELFHLLTLAGYACHYAATYLAATTHA
jgi:hemolysin III